VRRIDLLLYFWIALICGSLATPRAFAQTPCFGSCNQFSGTYTTLLCGTISYSFDNSTLALLGDQADQNEFKTEVGDAFSDWSQKTGRAATQATTGVGNVTVKVSDSIGTNQDAGNVRVDPSNSTRRIVTIYYDFPGWAPESKDRLLSHEIGHVFGLVDITPTQCSSFTTVMRQLSGYPQNYVQLQNGYQCRLTPNCTAADKLPQPQRPTTCDASIALAKCSQAGGGTCYNMPITGSCPNGTTSVEQPNGTTSCCYSSPILIDLEGDGFDLTDEAHGVYFDIGATRRPVLLSWTSPASDDAWLCLDRNLNGTIDDGRELFGNVTPQPPSSEPNGFLALALFDLAQEGGTGDGRIDSRDAVWTSLRLWVDRDHDGVSDQKELYPPQRLGLGAVELRYAEEDLFDEYGNWFRYRARVRGADGRQLGRWAWDVFLLTNSSAGFGPGRSEQVASSPNPDKTYTGQPDRIPRHRRSKR
jgi:hypothetical protein